MTPIPILVSGVPSRRARPAPPAGGGGGELLTGWFSDWATQTADLGSQIGQPAVDRIRDTVNGTPRWNDSARHQHSQVVTAPAVAPFAKMVAVIYPDSSNGMATRLEKSDLTIPGSGENLNWRWYTIYDMTSGLGLSQDNHGMGNQHADAATNFVYCFSYQDTDEWGWKIWALHNADPNGDWGIWSTELSDSDSPNSLGQLRLPIGHLYRIETQLHRVSAGLFDLRMWWYDAETTPETLLFDTTDLVNNNGSASGLTALPNLVIHSADTYASFEAGSNGVNITGSPVFPIAHHRYGGFAAVHDLPTDSQIGPYGTVTNGIETETPV